MSENTVGCNLVRLVSKPDEPGMSIADGLRNLADKIEADEKCGVAQPVLLAWVVSSLDYDAKLNSIEAGILGKVRMPMEETYFLFGKAMRSMEGCYE